MGVSKVILNGSTLIDVTQDTVASENLLTGYTATGNDGESVTGAYSPPTFSTQTKSVTPTESAQAVTPDANYDGLSSVSVGAISSTYVGSGITVDPTPTASGATVTIPEGYYSEQTTKSVATTTHPNPTASVNTSTGLITASHTQGTGYVTGGTTTGTTQLTTQAAKTVTPTESEQTAVAANRYTTGEVKVGAISSTYVGSDIDQNDSTDLTVSGATVTAPAGYYAESASASVASGTAGTPTATKGTVSNHSVTVTPSVTNTTGYITGGTVNGTAVSVSASELVSGTLSITSSGTKDVTNYASASVAAGSATTPATTITANPSISVNSSGLITASVSGSKSVTPTVSAGFVSSGTAGTVSVSGSNTSQLTAKAATTYYPSTSDQTISSGQYLTGAQTIKAVTTSNLTAENIAEGVTVTVGDADDADRIVSVTGTHSGGGYDEELLKKIISRTTTAMDSFEWPAGLTTVGEYAFYKCRFSAKNLPDTVTTIENYAFYGNSSMAMDTLPDGVTKIGNYAFYSTNLSISSLPSRLTTIGSGAFSSCGTVSISVIPSTVTAINNSAFYNCPQIVSISGEGAITTLGTTAFGGTNSPLASASFPNASISTLGAAFGNTTATMACQLLAFCDIGTITTIAANAFANCYALETLVLRRGSAITALANVSAFLNTPMRGYNSLTGTVYVPSALISSYQTATNWSTLYNNGTVTFAAIEGSEYEL